ncbi:MAG: class I SAM-dependent methyltransferase [Alphaproteobacteria bacterium]|nr:MAG: class I SAM-dependent methyltransferase [Alphaproteobacteria bacterium]
MDNLESAVANHYGVPDLLTRILKALETKGVDLDNLTPDDLAPVDEFHIGGRPATEYVVAKMSVSNSQHILDVGCGIGGATRYLASQYGCRVTGIDLTPDYIEVARELAARTGLDRQATYEVASALNMPFDEAHFDGALTLHVAMNIRDRAGLYGEVARVLKPDAIFCVYDVMKGQRDGLIYPVPWADTAETSHLTSPDETAMLLENAGFQVREIEDRKDFAIAFFRQSLQAVKQGPAPLGLHLLMGPLGKRKFDNMLANLEQGHVSPVIIIAQRGP